MKDKTLADLIVEHGPFTDDALLAIAGPMSSPTLVNALRDELIELRRLRANALAMAEEYERTPRPVASLAVASMLRDWCYAIPGTDFS